MSTPTEHKPIPAREWIRILRRQRNLNPNDPWITLDFADIEVIQENAFEAGKQAVKQNEKDTKT